MGRTIQPPPKVKGFNLEFVALTTICMGYGSSRSYLPRSEASVYSADKFIEETATGEFDKYSDTEQARILESIMERAATAPEVTQPKLSFWELVWEFIKGIFSSNYKPMIPENSLQL